MPTVVTRLDRRAGRLLPTSIRRGIGRRSDPSWVRAITHDEGVVLQHVREGRFQRAMAGITVMAALLSGAEVAYEHYRGSYSQRAMYSPVILSGLLATVAAAAAVSKTMARKILPIVSLIVIADGLIGFVFHVRGIARKPGGWRIPVVNVVMGPPVFAPLLFALSGYMGLVTSFLRREGQRNRIRVGTGVATRHGSWVESGLAMLGRDTINLENRVSEGRFQKNLAVVAGASAIFSGIEAAYSHYENDFQYRKLQVSPLLISPALGLVGIGSAWSARLARTALRFLSLLAIADGMIGTFFHLRGVLRRPGGYNLALYNVIYGPPIFAPMLFAASGFMGLLASLLRRAD